MSSPEKTKTARAIPDQMKYIEYGLEDYAKAVLNSADIISKRVAQLQQKLIQLSEQVEELER